jgi:hypothetical protein
VGDNINIMNKNTEEQSICQCLAIISWDKIITKFATTSFENVLQFRYLGMEITNPNLIQEEIKSRLNPCYACFHSVQNMLSFLLFINVKITIHKNIIVPLVLYGCETLSLTLKGEHRLKVCENRVLRRLFGVTRDEMVGDWRKLHNEEFHNLYSLSNIIGLIKSRRMPLEEHVICMREQRNAYRVLIEKPEGKLPL